jgi:hypothetical protein
MASALSACHTDVQQQTTQKRYFDLAGFIHADSARLSQAHTPVTKTVMQNGTAPQTKHLTIKNWGQELHLFAASDINKPAWRDSYRIQQQGDSTVYVALQPQLTTRRILVVQQNKQVKKISIDNSTQNILYQTTEHLVYYPDSLYQIDKLQKIKLIGSNRYQVIGKIK